MKLKIVHKEYLNLKYRNYRGIERETPGYAKNLPEGHKVNRVFFEYLQKSDNAGVTSDLALCKEMLLLYSLLTPPQILVVIELVDINKPSSFPDSEFLGYDLVFADTHSLLAATNGLRFEIINEAPPSDSVYSQLLSLFRLIADYFSPEININGLFDSPGIAQYCLDAMMAIQSIIPSIWENETFIYEVKGIYALKL